jgi:PKD repeat protein
VGTLITATARFTDVDVLDTHTALWTWGDGGTSSGVLNETAGTGTVTGTHAYNAAGIYTIQVTVTDNHGASGTSTFTFIVVYDPDGGFVTGGGWFTAPAGAYRPNQALTGRVNLGFVAKYHKNDPLPDGETEFNFSIANFNFHSSQYQWLVVSGARAQFRGTGTVNGAGNYGFMVTAIDGSLSVPSGPDKFRIKVWDASNGNAIVFDNEYGASDDADPVTPLQGGSIVIHR